MKDIIPDAFEYYEELQGQVAACPNVRTFVDTIPELQMFVYRFLAGDLLRFNRQPLSKEARKGILRSALTGLAALHDKRIIHTDYAKGPADGSPTITSVQIGDLEDTAQLPENKNIAGRVCGNQLWRSPELWAEAKQNTSSDIFSFGLVAAYVIMGRVMLLEDDTELMNRDDAWRYILRRQIKYFADEESLVGLLEHIGEEKPYFERIVSLVPEFNSRNPRRPVRLWTWADTDEEFKDLVA